MKIKRGSLHYCAAPLCDEMVNTNKYCSTHLRRLQRHGDIDILSPPRHRKRTARQIIEDYSMPVPESGCWVWVGGVSGVGYPIVNLDGKHISGHRLSYQIFRGDIPEGLFVLHKCDIRCCVNPDHLFLGTAQDNTDDMFRKGRNGQPKGEKAGRAKVTESQVLEIRKLNMSASKIAAIYCLSKSSVIAIKKRRSWAHIP